MQFFDSKIQYKPVKKAIESAVLKVFNSGIYISGKEVEAFEKKVVKFLNVRHAISVNSGTDALLLSLKGLGIKQGDEVITTPFTFIATAEVIANIGAVPVFADIDPKTLNINPSEIERKITKKTKAIIPVHLFGLPAQMDEIIKIANKYNLYVIEDAAQAIGAKFNNKFVGTMGDAGCFSFFPSKNLGAYGDGGMIVTNNNKLADNLLLLRNHGSSRKNKYHNLVLGFNSRLDAVQAAILRIKIKYLKKWNNERLNLAKRYNNGLKNITLPEINSGCVFNQYTIRTRNRDGLRNYLFKKGIETNIYYPVPLHFQPAFKYLGYKKGDFKESELAAKEVLSLPIYPGLNKQEKIIKEINKFYASE